jgi:hypothetical protein
VTETVRSSPVPNTFSTEIGKVCGILLCLTQRETDTSDKRSHNRGKRDMSSIQTPVVYVEHSGRWGTLCKVNQVVTPNSLPNVNHFNMDTLWSKHPEPAHPDRDPVCLNCICGHSQPQNLEDFWSSDAGSEFLDKWFKIPKICQYFRTRSPVTMTGIDG